MKPLNTTLYAQVKKDADKKFLSRSSVYKSAWIVREYKKQGGTFDDKIPQDKNKGLLRWFHEKWENLNNPGQPCGRQKATTEGIYPLCRPTVKVNKDTPTLKQELTLKDISRANKLKQRIKNHGKLPKLKK